VLPQRLAQHLAAKGTMANVRDAISQRCRTVEGLEGRARRSEGYAKARSRWAASIPTSCRRARWSRGKVPGLFVIGEAVDVTRLAGGYNFQWAWSSGWVGR